MRSVCCREHRGPRWAQCQGRTTTKAPCASNSGDIVLFYTDGLVERRGWGIQGGIDAGIAEAEIRWPIGIRTHRCRVRPNPCIRHWPHVHVDDVCTVVVRIASPVS